VLRSSGCSSVGCLPGRGQGRWPCCRPRRSPCGPDRSLAGCPTGRYL